MILSINPISRPVFRFLVFFCHFLTVLNIVHSKTVLNIVHSKTVLNIVHSKTVWFLAKLKPSVLLVTHDT